MRLTPRRLKPCHVTELRPGEHIAVPRPEGYTHHGIFMGEGRVAHFSDEAGLVSKSRSSVRETSLDDFLMGGRLLRRRYTGGWPPKVVITRARSVLDGEVSWNRYHLINNNCEHFATFCAARQPRSLQVRKVAGATALATLALGGSLLQKRLRRRA